MSIDSVPSPSLIAPGGGVLSGGRERRVQDYPKEEVGAELVSFFLLGSCDVR